ncbi:MAG: hypothetical protein MJ193_00060 [Clostridia bacterium]|nr:hypothetical protein [Clostridia bacterium]
MKTATSQMKQMVLNAKKRLSTENSYSKEAIALEPPARLTPSEKDMFLKIRKRYEKNLPLEGALYEYADERIFDGISHNEKQRIILTACGDYVSMKELLLSRLAACHEE